MVSLFEGLIGLIWLFPVLYLLFGNDDVWWVLTLIEIGSTIMVLTKTDRIFNKIDEQTKMEGNDVYWLYEYINKEDKK